jgi:uncharacterized sporulation protein YeaH/YhbH (DUF444 family)
LGLNIVDKRLVKRDRTTENRQKFLKRVKDVIKEQMPDLINSKNIKDIGKSGGKIKIKKTQKTFKEPWFHHGPGGHNDYVVPGNHDKIVGDTARKPPGSGGSGTDKQAGNGEDEEGDFEIELSREEFLDYFFEDLELPDMVESELRSMESSIQKPNGFQNEGSPNKLSVIRSYKNAFGRRLAAESAIQEEIDELEKLPRTEETAALILELKKTRDEIPLFDDVDLRYRTSVKVNLPTTHATMCMIMDNSGSMGIHEKTIARKFFYLLYSFLIRQYEGVDLVFISHTTTAKEMGEDEFFNTKLTGGTKVSSSLDLLSEIMTDRLIGKTNIYVAQVSDGDNEETDNGTCREILDDEILPNSNYYCYIEVKDEASKVFSNILTPYSGSTPSKNTLWETYKNVSADNKKLQIRRVQQEKQIWGVFSELFKKRNAK